MSELDMSAYISVKDSSFHAMMATKMLWLLLLLKDIP